MSDSRLVFQLRRELAAARAANQELLAMAIDATERLASEACAFAFDLGLNGVEHACSMEHQGSSGVGTRAPVEEQPHSTLRDNEHLALEK